MPINRDVPINLKTKEVIRRPGIKEHPKLRSKAETSTCEMLSSMDEAHTIKPGLRNLFSNLRNVNRG